MGYPLNLNDVRFEVFRRGRGPGGQHMQKNATSIRAIHEPTGLLVTCCNERSQHANKQESIRLLQARLDRMLEDRLVSIRRDAHESKPAASFASQVRTYRLCGNPQGVVDHRTGFSHPNARAVLRGDLDGFLAAQVGR